MFHFRVRNENGWCHGAEPPKPSIQFVNRTARQRKILRRVGARRASRKGKARKILLCLAVPQIKNILNPAERGKLYKFPNRNQTISTPRLNPLPDLHLEPIKVVICDLSMISNLGAGFSLRCFQRLSHPDIATRRCPWQDSRHTRGRSTLILSYREQSSSKI